MGKLYLCVALLLMMYCMNPVIVGADSHFNEAYDVIIDVGHGGIDGGTSFNEFLEKDINLAIGIKLYEELKKRSFNVGITRIRDNALSDDSWKPHLRSRHVIDLKQRELIADSLKPKIFVSLHVNWSKNKHRRGPVVVYQASEASFSLAHVLQSHLNEFYGVKKNILRGNSYFLMKHLEMPSVIIEMGYLSNHKDRTIMIEEHTQDQLVHALVQAIEEYFLIYPVIESDEHESIVEVVQD
ncbi:N-acetylmuramoyl-L-alanine amidase [bacterium LRH843]|nr:N-acetylmuramoyl-L-alanine amidase [bacterium LRH843]